MKHLKLVALLALIIGCSPQEHLEVKAIDILPPGGDVDSVTAYVNIQGAGIVRLDWERRAYGVDSLVQTEYWYIDSSDVYTSTLSVTDGWYWLSIYDEDSVLLATSDVVFYGTGSQLPPIAKFYGEPTSGEAPLQVEFYDQSLNDPISWLLDYGDGESAEYPQNHYYEEPGNYDVTLIVSNLAGMDTLTKKNYIQVELAPPVALFDAEPRVTAPTEVIEFRIYDQCFTNCNSFDWDFGDGHTAHQSSKGNYEHSYSATGIYTVTLIAENTSGADTMIKEDYIEIGLPPVAGFYAKPTEGPIYTKVYFYPTCEYDHDKWLNMVWYVGIDTLISSGNYGVSCIYRKAGTYTITLIASNVFGRDSLTKKDYIHIHMP